MPQQRQATVSIDNEVMGEDAKSKTRRRKATNVQERRSLPWYLKFVIVMVLMMASLIGGLAVGYSMMGNGPVSEAFDPATYKHIYDLVFKMD